ncbi:uncharacterized protein LOC128331367 [Hemicordylus capensis]|uniref:uncharacterized protein LOC128331367 n=1 Tax=Hemicordylus capensis TaxID=884348 RepID=UPI0023042074|nr:uncharacterized protein LOC128331367 [Hemicordylus capensis]
MEHVTHLRAYAEAVHTAKKKFWLVRIASADSCSAELSQVVKSLISTSPVSNQLPEVLCCDALSEFFADKICIRANLDSTFSAGSTKEVSSNPSCSIRLDQFQSVIPEDVDKLLGAVWSTTCSLDPCPTWLLRSSREIIRGGLVNIINALLREGKVPPCLKEAITRPFLNKPSLDPSAMGNYRPISNLPWLGKVIERVVADQLQPSLEETDYLDQACSTSALLQMLAYNSHNPWLLAPVAGAYGSCSPKTAGGPKLSRPDLDPFQTGFRAGYGVETALVGLMDDLYQGIGRGSVTLLVLLDLLVAFDTINHGILPGRLVELGIRGTALQ